MGALSGNGELLVRGTGVANVEKIQFGITTGDTATETGVVAVGVGGTNTGGILNVGAGGISRGFVGGVMPAQVQLGENALITAKADFSSDADWVISGTTNGPTIQARPMPPMCATILRLRASLNGDQSGINQNRRRHAHFGRLQRLCRPDHCQWRRFGFGTAQRLDRIYELHAGQWHHVGHRRKRSAADYDHHARKRHARFGRRGGAGTAHFGTNATSLTGIAWGGTLTVQNWTNGFDHLFFGFDATGLDAAQVSKITFAGLGTAKISATGEVTPVNPGPVLKKGDLNLDTHVNAADLTAMLSALTDGAAFEASHALNDDKLFTIGDMDSDGQFTNLDLQGMISFIQSGQGSVAPVPEPASVALLGIAGLFLLGQARSNRKCRGHQVTENRHW